MPSLKHERISLVKAQAIAKELVAKLEPVCHRIEVAGSIRRQRPDIGDIDLVAIPQSREIRTTDMFGNVVHAYTIFETLGFLAKWKDAGIVQIGKSGDQITSFTYQGMACDLYHATEETFPTIFLVRTGSENWNRFLACVALSQGKRFKVNGQGIVRQGEQAGYLSEEHILGAVGLPFIPPEEREVPLSALSEPDMGQYFEYFQQPRKTLLQL